jgi:hypothetical protein
MAPHHLDEPGFLGRYFVRHREIIDAHRRLELEREERRRLELEEEQRRLDRRLKRELARHVYIS